MKSPPTLTLVIELEGGDPVLRWVCSSAEDEAALRCHLAYTPGLIRAATMLFALFQQLAGEAGLLEP